MGSVNCKTFSTSQAANSDTSNSGMDTGKCTSTISSQPEADYVEGVVCSTADIAENEMKQFDLADGKVLLVKQNGRLSALGTKCTHYGALLSTGALGEGRIRCPWHGACFSLATGDIEDFPGQDSLPCYQVTVRDGEVRVRAKRSELAANRRIPMMVSRKQDDERSFLIIGGGPSGAICAETLRQEGFTGRIVMVCKEPYNPYDRTKVSKQLDFDVKKVELRTDAFYEQHSIEVMKGVAATKLDTAARQVTLDNGYVIKFTQLFLATGSSPRRVSVPGASLPQVMTLRNYEDAAAANALLSSDKHVVVLGNSFIALEAAAFCVGKAASVTVLGRSRIPLAPVFGEAVGERILELFTANGVQMRDGVGIKEFVATNGVLTGVELTNGERLPADLAVLGIGSTLNTEFLAGCGINVNADGTVPTDACLRTNIEGIYAGGDIAHAPVYSAEGKNAAIGHYPLAQYHGRIAGLNMSGKETQLQAVPYFWTNLFGKSFRYAGYGKAHDVQVEGDLVDLKFVAFYFDAAGKVIAMASCGRDPVVSQFAERQSQGVALHRDHLVGDPFAWTKPSK